MFGREKDRDKDQGPLAPAHDAARQKRKYGCRKCGSTDVDFGARYIMIGDYYGILCDACRELMHAPEFTALPWVLASQEAVSLYNATVIRYYGRQDLSEAEVAAILR